MSKTNPSTYEKKYIKSIDKYISSCTDTRRGLNVIVNLPTIEGLAVYIGVSRKTIYNWKKEQKDFKIALEKLQTEQLTRLINSGLAGTYNSTIAKLMLSHNHGMKERSDMTSDDEPIPLLDYVKTRDNNGDK